MKFEQPMYSDGIGKAKQTTFRGLNHNPGAGDGQIYEMQNLGSDFYPLLATRQKRRTYKTKLTKCNGLYAATERLWVDGADLYYSRVKKKQGELEDSLKNFAAINRSVIILPDKKIYDTEENALRNMAAKISVVEATTGEKAFPQTAEATATPLQSEPPESVWFDIGPDYYQPGRAYVRFIFNENDTDRTLFQNGKVITIRRVNGTGSLKDRNDGVRVKLTEVSITGTAPRRKANLRGIILNGRTVEAMIGDSWTDTTRFEIDSLESVTFGTDTISWSGADFSGFVEGEYAFISGCSNTGNNGLYQVDEISGNTIRFTDASFTQGSGTEENMMIVQRTKPTMIFKDGTLYGEEAEANTIYWEGEDFAEYFKAGDAVEISGSSIAGNNKTAIIREVCGDELHFYENSFTNGADSGESMTIARNIPDLIFAFECENRLWGTDGKTIYASKLGDPTNWYVYDGLETDSWTIDVGGFGDITAGICYQGYPTFMRDGDLYKIFGSMPSNFELIRVAEAGCAAGSSKSLAIAGETLFYHNSNGIYAYAGGTPALISQPLGLGRYKNAVAGSDGLKYYVSMQECETTWDGTGTWHLFVYDTQRGLWHEEDDTHAIDFAYWDGNLYYADAEGNLTITGNLNRWPCHEIIYTAIGGLIGSPVSVDYQWEEEENFDWYAEFTDFTDDSPNKKDFKRLQIRLELDEDTEDPPWVKAKLMMDSDGEWIDPEGGTVEDPEKRSYLMTIIPRRADHYRLRLEGHGGCRIYSIAREFSEGSDLKSVKGRQ